MAKKSATAPAATATSPTPPASPRTSEAARINLCLNDPFVRCILQAARDHIECAVARRTWLAVETWFPGATQQQIASRLRLNECKVSRWKNRGIWSTESLLQTLLLGPLNKTVGRDWTELYFENEAKESVLDFPNNLNGLNVELPNIYRCALFAARRYLHPNSPPAELSDEQLLSLLLMFRHSGTEEQLSYRWALPLQRNASDDARALARFGSIAVHQSTLDTWGDTALKTFRVLQRFFNLPPARR